MKGFSSHICSEPQVPNKEFPRDVCVYASAYKCVCTHIHACIYIYVCMHVYVYVYIYTQL